MKSKVIKISIEGENGNLGFLHANTQGTFDWEPPRSPVTFTFEAKTLRMIADEMDRAAGKEVS